MKYLQTLCILMAIASCQNPTPPANQSTANNSIATPVPTPATTASGDSATKTTAETAPKPTESIKITPPPVPIQKLTADTLKKIKPKHVLEGKYEFNGFLTGMSAGYLVDNVSMEISGSRISGSAGCNRYFGDIELKKKRGIKFSKIGETKKMCDEDLMATERHLVNLLAKTNRFSIEADRVEFYEGEEPLMSFKKIK